MVDSDNNPNEDHVGIEGAVSSVDGVVTSESQDTLDSPKLPDPTHAIAEDLDFESSIPFPLRVLVGIGLSVLIMIFAVTISTDRELNGLVLSNADTTIDEITGSTLFGADGATASTLQGSATEPEEPDTKAPAIPNQIVFEDNFTSLDTDTWTVENISSFGDGNNEEQCYLEENVRVERGKLILTAREETVQCKNDRREVTSGMVRSKGVQFKPGQAIEYRVKLTPADETNQAGLWPALWASSFGGGGWPLGGEIDFFEVMTARNPKRAIFSIHFLNSSDRKEAIQKEIFFDRNFSLDWHTFRFDYGQGGKLVWYMNGEVVQTVTNADTKQGYPAPFNATINQLRVNLALGGNPGPLDRRAVRGGATYEIDYIRIFEL